MAVIRPSVGATLMVVAEYPILATLVERAFFGARKKSPMDINGPKAAPSATFGTKRLA